MKPIILILGIFLIFSVLAYTADSYNVVSLALNESGDYTADSYDAVELAIGEGTTDVTAPTADFGATATAAGTYDQTWIQNSITSIDEDSGLENQTLYWYNSSALIYTLNDTKTGQKITVTTTFNHSGLAYGTYYINGTACNKVNLCNSTGTRTITLASGDSCTYSSGDWEIDCNDNCSIESNVDVGGNDLIFSGLGNFWIRANITNYGSLSLSDECTIAFEAEKYLIS